MTSTNEIMTQFIYPHTIDNGSGERLLFERRVPGAQGERLVGKNWVTPGSGPPMHVHHHQDEALTVQQGRIGYQRLGESPKYAGPGEEVLFKAGEAHRFWNAGNEELICTAYIEPPDNIEYYLGSVFDSQKRNGGHKPDIFEAAFLMTRYRSEFGMLEIPAPVQRFVFPIIVAVGRLLGKYERYTDAPEPLYTQ